MSKLSDTQAALLSAAAARPDLSLRPIPPTIKLKGASLERALQALVSRKLVVERKTSGRRAAQMDKQLFVTPAGLAAIGIDLPRTAPPPNDDRSGRARPSGKLGVLLDACTHPEGATLDELTEASGWLPHTTRAALTRLRQRGFDLRLATAGGRKAYHLFPAT